MSVLQTALDGWRKARDYGASYVLRRVREKVVDRLFHPYDRLQKQRAPGAETLAFQRAHQPCAGRISILVPVYNTSPRMLSEMLDSFLAQTYADWEACLYDASTREETWAVLREYAGRDSRIRVTFGQANDGISGNTNRALAMAGGEWTALCDHDDLYTPDALWHIASCIEREQPDMVYTDEDKITEDSRYLTDPHFKPDFCPDNLRSSNYICHLICVRRSLMEKVGGERSAFDGSQDHDLALRCAEHTDRIGHVPEICYHWRTVRSSESHQHLRRCMEAACRATEEHMARLGYPGRAWMERGVQRLAYELPGDRRIDLIVLERGGEGAGAIGETVRRCGWDAAVRSVPGDDVRALAEAVRRSDRPWVLLMDSRLTAADPAFPDELMMYAQRADVGAVTPAVLDRRGRIVHAGWAVDGQGRCHGRNRGLKLLAGGSHLMAMRVQNVSAVSSLCAMARRDALRDLPEDFDTVEGALTAWCLRAQAAGLRHVYTPWARAALPGGTWESPLTDRDRQRLRKALPENWHDPCWSVRLDIRAADFRKEAQE